MHTVVFHTIGGDLSLFDCVVQGLGILGIVCSIVAFQCKRHRVILAWRTANEMLFGVQYLLLCAYTGAAMNFTGSARNLVFARQVERGQKTVVSRLVFSALFLLFSLFTWEGYKSILIGLAKILSTFAYGCKNTTLLRLIILSTTLMWLTYNVLVGSLTAVLCEALTLASLVISFARLCLPRRAHSDTDTQPLE